MWRCKTDQLVGLSIVDAQLLGVKTYFIFIRYTHEKHPTPHFFSFTCIFLLASIIIICKDVFIGKIAETEKHKVRPSTDWSTKPTRTHNEKSLHEYKTKWLTHSKMSERLNTHCGIFPRVGMQRKSVQRKAPRTPYGMLADPLRAVVGLVHSRAVLIVEP